MNGKVLKLFIIDENKICKQTYKVLFINGYGIKGDKHADENLRQVSILTNSSLKSMRDMGYDVRAEDFYMNMLIDGLSPHDIKIGDVLSVNGKALLEIVQIGSSSEKEPNCDVYKRYGMCIMQKEGIFAKVVKDGSIQMGDNVRVT